MDKKTFGKYLMAGHGRCYDEVRKDPVRYRKVIMNLCLTDTSFDMQCEGSRALYAYDLVMLYDDISPFVKKTVKAFLTADNDDDSSQFRHLCDLVCLFAYESGDDTAVKAVKKKYSELHGMLMTRRFSTILHRVANNYEYLAIHLLTSDKWELAEMIARDLGAWFIRRRKTDAEDLHWEFLWLWHEMNDVFGKDAVQEHFAPLCRTSREIKRFIDVMSLPETKPDRTPRPSPDADTVIKAVTDGSVKTTYDMIKLGFMRMDEDDRKKLAEAVINEEDERRKALMLGVFRTRFMKWPCSDGKLIEYAEAGDEDLRLSAVIALTYIKGDGIREYALRKLSEDDSDHREQYVEMLINNCCADDTAVITGILENTVIDPDAEPGWHGIVLDILNADNDNLPDALYMWIYENSICSCCRCNAAEKLIKRGTFPEECMRECLHDCNTDTRELVTGTPDRG